MLAACSTTPPTARPQAQPIPDSLLPPVVVPEMTPRQRIVDIADQEWRRWGAQTLRVEPDGRGCIRDSPLPPPSAFLAAQAAAAASSAGAVTLLPDVSPCWQFVDGSGMEATPQGCALALRYWHILGREPDCAQITTARWAWSAAFISWVMRQAGLTNEQFLTGEAHNMYVADARDGLLSAGAFGVEPWPALPRPGDMICSARSTVTDITDVEQIVFGHTPMHCDIVIAVDMQSRTLQAIGGNVQQSVSLSTMGWGVPPVPVSSGLAVAPVLEDEASATRTPWLLVMRNRLQ